MIRSVATPANPTVIVGAGPHALTIAARLVHDRLTDPDQVHVIDPAGGWLAAWRRQFARFEIDHLRSPSVHHPHPEPYALLEFARDRHRQGELRGRYQSPTTALFADFCNEVIDEYGLADAVTTGRVSRVDPDGCVEWVDEAEAAHRVGAARVVIATNSMSPTMPPDLVSIPDVERPDDAPPRGHRPIHAGAVDVDRAQHGDHVVVIGGGLTAAHLSVCATQRGALVTLVSRRHLVEREFDTDPGWLGPRHMTSYLRTSCLATRAQMASDARGGGSIPSWMMLRLSELERCGALTHRLVEPDRGMDGAGTQSLAAFVTSLDPDHVWCASGWHVSTTDDPLLAPLVESTGCELVDQLLVLGPLLELPRTTVPIHVVGRPATLQLGPTAGNLAGARRAAELIVGDDPDTVR